MRTCIELYLLQPADGDRQCADARATEPSLVLVRFRHAD